MANLVEKICSIALREVKNTFSFIWKVQYRQEDQIRFAESPDVSPYFLPETFWSLSLFQNGEQIALYLNRDGNGPEAVVIDFELSLLTLGELPQCVRVCRSHTFLKKDQYCYDDFLRIDDGRVKCVPLWFPNNSLTVRCRIWQAERVIFPTSFFFSTVFIKDRVTVDWCIKNYTQSDDIPGYHSQFKTQLLGAVSFSFYLIIDTDTNCPTDVQIVLWSINMREIGRLLCTISTQTTSGKLKNRITEDCPKESWYTNNFVWDFPYAIDRYDAKTFVKAYFPDDILNLRFEFDFRIAVSDESEAHEVSNSNFGESSSSENESSPSDDCTRDLWVPQSDGSNLTMYEPSNIYIGDSSSDDYRRNPRVLQSSGSDLTENEPYDIGDRSSSDDCPRNLRAPQCDGSDLSVHESSNNFDDSSSFEIQSSASDDYPRNLWVPQSDGSDPTEYERSNINFDNSSSSERERERESSPSENESSSSAGGQRNLTARFPDSNSGHENSAIGNTALGQKDYTVGNIALGQKDSAVRDSAIDSKDSAAGDSTLINKDSAVGDCSLGQRDTTQSSRPCKKQKLN